MNRVGHAFFKRRMRETNAIFGGEVTGHYYFRDNFYADNGFIPALLILELMSKKGQSLHELLEPLRRRYFISGEINTKLASMDLVPAKLDGHRGAGTRTGSSTRLDGISVEYPDWHFNVRPSNTEPLLRLNLEGGDARADGREARRGARADSRLIYNWRVAELVSSGIWFCLKFTNSPTHQFTKSPIAVAGLA